MNVNDKHVEISHALTNTELSKSKKSTQISSIAKTALAKKQADPEQIIPRLTELLQSAEIAGGKESRQIKALSLQILQNSSASLQKALKLGSEEDLCLRMAEIASQQLTSPQQQCRQLSDLNLYLTLLSHRVNVLPGDLTPDDKRQLTALVKQVRETLDLFTRATAPAWTKHRHLLPDESAQLLYWKRKA